MKGINFIVQKLVSDTVPSRVDVACFVGLVSTRKSDKVLKDEAGIKTWLEQRGYFQFKEKKNEGDPDEYLFSDVEQLLDVPIPIEDWQTFDRLFAWDQRSINNSHEKCFTYLGVAVKSFFEQGGRKCYIVRVDEPAELGDDQKQRKVKLKNLLVGKKTLVKGLAGDRGQWTSFVHLFGLDDVSFLSLPDLPDLCQNHFVEAPARPAQKKTPPEEFVECSHSFDAEPTILSLDYFSPPYCNSLGIKRWGKKLQRIAGFVAQLRREVQLIASIPLLYPSLEESVSLLDLLHHHGLLTDELDPLQLENKKHTSIASAFVQLGYPWLQTDNAWRLPQQLECPEGAMIGMLANNALTRGTFHSATAIEPANIIDVYPSLGQHEIYNIHSAPEEETDSAALIDRVSIFSPTIDGIHLLSDVTTSNNSAYMAASVSRLTALIIRAARLLGEEYIFETNGERLWNRIKGHLTEMMGLLFQLGAFRGESTEQAFQVQCDRSTMTQNDLDAGRVIAQIQFLPTVSIETINIMLNLVKTQGTAVSTIGIQEAYA